MADTWDNSIPRELATCLEDRGTSRSEHAAKWLHAHENDDYVWDLIGGLLDRLESMAAGE